MSSKDLMTIKLLPEFIKSNIDSLKIEGRMNKNFFFAVFVVRGLLPWIIIWATVPELGPIGALTATFSNDPSIHTAIEESAPILLLGGGIFLVFLFASLVRSFITVACATFAFVLWLSPMKFKKVSSRDLHRVFPFL